MQSVILELQIICNNHHRLPSKITFQHWLEAFLPQFKNKSEVTIRIVDIEESQHLNMIYRGKNKPTNVLSFPFKTLYSSPVLGDLVICRQIIEKESIEQQKNLYAHWAHIVIHGCLHLLDFDHQNNNDAQKMEKIEIKIMKKLGYPNPY